MSAEDNKAAIRRLMEEGFNGGDESVIRRYVAPNFMSNEGESMRATGPEGFIELAAVFKTAFPDGRFILEDIVAEGDKVVTWATFTGTHEGPLQGMPPTGKSVRVKDIDLYRFENGMIVEVRPHFDQLSMLQQLGVMGGAEEEH